MTVATLREAGHHAGWMRNPVTALAGWNRLMLVLVTRYAQYGFVFSIAAGKHFKCTLVTRCTHLVRCIRSHEDRRRHMCLVTFFTFCSHHIRAVRFVALCTEWNLAMNIMAEAASQTTVLALNLFQLNNLLSMAGQTLISDIVCQLDDFRGVWITMATQTTGQVVVSLAGMTLTTDRNNFFNGRWVAGMTILTRYACLVSTAISGNVSRRGHVTLDTVGTGQHRAVGSKSTKRQRSNQHG